MPGVGVRSARPGALMVIAFDRHVDADPGAVWEALTNPHFAARWIGPLASGRAPLTFELTLAEEPGRPVVPVSVLEVDPGHFVVVRLGHAASERVVTICLDSAPHTSTSTITVIQSFTSAEQLTTHGPWWDWLLDRFASALEGRALDEISLRPRYLAERLPHYEGLIRQAIREGRQPDHTE